MNTGMIDREFTATTESPAQWRRDLAEWPTPAFLIDATLTVVDANAGAAAAGIAAGSTFDDALSVLAHWRAAATELALRVERVAAKELRGWFVCVSGGDGGDAIAQRLAASNLKLQDEIGRRRFLERQLLSVSENEKQRISLELHDGLGQHLTGVAFVARSLADKLRATGHPQAADADWLVRLLNEATSKTRGLARGLWPVSLERDSLGQSIGKMAEDLESIYGVSCAVQVVDEPRIASQFAAHHIFRVVQEAATNAIKHGRARRLTFRLEAIGNAFHVSVVNDGLPVDRERIAAATGLGVIGMRLRADAVAGQLSIEPLAAGGCEVALTLPGVSGSRSA